jgi:hypothetical protein
VLQEFCQTCVRQIAEPDVVIAKLVFVPRIVGQPSVGMGETLIIGLVSDGAAQVQQAGRGVGHAAADQHRHGVNGDGLGQQFADFQKFASCLGIYP